MNNLAPTSVIALAVMLTGLSTPARADLMSSCAPEIEQFCTDVDTGEGRASACLAGHMEKLGAACRPEVQAVATGLLVPDEVRMIFDPGFRADLPPACEAEAARFCPEVEQGDGRIFACLYAREDRVTESCSTAAQDILEAGS